MRHNLAGEHVDIKVRRSYDYDYDYLNDLRFKK